MNFMSGERRETNLVRESLEAFLVHFYIFRIFEKRLGENKTKHFSAYPSHLKNIHH